MTSRPCATATKTRKMKRSYRLSSLSFPRITVGHLRVKMRRRSTVSRKNKIKMMSGTVRSIRIEKKNSSLNGTVVKWSRAVK